MERQEDGHLGDGFYWEVKHGQERVNNAERLNVTFTSEAQTKENVTVRWLSWCLSEVTLQKGLNSNAAAGEESNPSEEESESSHYSTDDEERRRGFPEEQKQQEVSI
ncbi:hypothetical protein F7725_024687 [Dissostichus mawsoni]|uniref:Uncharacterized protein n=1 Tax=Dissostichus mawsoni TaxID=36200 RepID=A0A7J5X9I9_DISMA|nr:hypothetical protein F7725_024687 [Dissostichus mawsoni]